jgi:hypothetical protein
MAYTASGLTIISDAEYDLGRVVRVASTNGSIPVQCYVSGVLTQTVAPADGVARFVLNAPGPLDVLFFLACDDGADHFAEAFPEVAANGNRITVNVPATMDYSPGDRLSVAIDSATIYDAELFPGGAGEMGFGVGGYGDSYGYDGGIGYGFGFGYQYGFGCRVVSVQSAPLVTGAHTVVTTITDAAGNAISDTQTVTLSTYPRPAASLAVSGYTQAIDALALSWTASPDV